ncbi:hypothetical protein [Ornithinimicrobium kibberense]|uniref:hypothetical protein n=1 Tax=Ornithinimicrobium kibberense TaxID=282060 RepID=UPI00361556DD
MVLLLLYSNRSGIKPGALQRHQHRPRADGRPRGRGRLPGPVPGRTLLPDGQVRPASPADLSPPARLDRGATDHRLRRAGDLPRGPATHRSLDQEDPQHPPAAAHRHHHRRRPPDHRRPPDPRRGARTPELPQPRGATKTSQLRPGTPRAARPDRP